MMERVSSGENLIGFIILGSYAEARAKSDPSLGIVYPKDYTLVLSRVSFISKEAGNPNAAKLWFDYVLSGERAKYSRQSGGYPSIRNDIEGKNDIDGMTKLLGNALEPIPVDDSLLEYLQPGQTPSTTSNSGAPPRRNNRDCIRTRACLRGARPLVVVYNHREHLCKHGAESGRACRAAWWC